MGRRHESRVAIREMTEDDLAGVVDIITSHSEFDGPPAKRYYLGFFRRKADGTSRENNYVAVDDENRVVGACGYAPDEYETPEILWLTWFYVAKGHVGARIGLKLFEHILAEVKRSGARKLYLDTSTDPIYARALAFYARSGFTQEGELADYYGPGEHVIIMGLSLR